MKSTGFFIFVSLVFGAGTLTASTSAANVTISSFEPIPIAQPTPSPEPVAIYSSYRGISIRMPAEKVAEKLGVPTQKSKAGDFYMISPTETVQISYDTDKTVKAISINFTGDLKTAPTPRDVLGEDVKKDAEGMISKMVSFPKDGFWISYIHTGGKDATIIITLQKLEPR